MSGYVAGLVWKAKIPGATLTEKGILALYGDVAHDDGTHIYRSKSSIAERAQTSKDTIKRVTRWLMKSGLLIEVSRSEGGRYRNTTEYKIDLGLLKALAGDLGDGQFEKAWATVSENVKKQDDSKGVHSAPPGEPSDAGGANSTRVESAPGAHSTHEGVHTAPPGGAPMHPPRETVLEPSKDTSSVGRAKKRSSDFSPFAIALWREATDPMRKRSSRNEVDAALAKCPEPPDRVLAALRAYVANDRDVAADRGQPALHRWIEWGRYQPWLEAESADPAAKDETWWRKAMAYHAKFGDWPEKWPPRDQCPAHILAEAAP